MSVSRAEITRWIVAGCFLSGSALADSGSFDPDTMERAEPPVAERSANVEVNTLKAPNAEGFGILDQTSGGFATTLWAGSSAKTVRVLLPMLPSATQSHTVRSLQRRLLLTAATPPEGAVEGDRPSLLELRSERLMALGDVDGVLSLSSAAPASLSGPMLGRVKLDALLLSGNMPGACLEAKRQMTAAPASDGLLEKTMILCHFINGNTLQGNMGLEVLHERKDKDAAFIAAAEVISGLPPAAPGKVVMEDLSPLHIAAYQTAKLPIPAPVAAKANAAEAKALTQSAANSLDVRLAAAEHAEYLGTLPIETLRKHYLDVSFPREEIQAALPAADPDSPRLRARLFRTATDQTDPSLRLPVIIKSLEMAEARGHFASAARLYADLLVDQKADSSLSAHAGQIIRALIVAGRYDKSGPWIEMLKADSTQEKTLLALWPYLTIAGHDAGQTVPLKAFQAWRHTLDSLPPERIAQRTALVLGCLSGLGAKLPDAAWLETLSLPAGGPKPGLFAMMQGAALDGRVGGTVLTALVNLGQATMANVDSLTLAESISALSVVGLGQEARKLAIEALSAHGL